MATAKNRAFKSRSMSAQSHSKAIAAIQILWKQMRPDLTFDKEGSREERLAWIAQFLGMKRELKSITDLSDKQLGLVLEEMRRLTGQPSKPRQNAPQSPNTATFGVVETTPSGGAEIIHLTTPGQLITLKKLEAHIGWTQLQRENYLQPRFRRTNFQMLTFKQANSLIMQMLNIAAHKDLKSTLGPDKKITRQMTAKYIPTLKQKLRIDQKGE
jgi:hypothetical protein